MRADCFSAPGPNHLEFVDNARGQVACMSLARVDDGGPNGAASSRLAIIDRSVPLAQQKVVGMGCTGGREAHGLWTNPANNLLYVRPGPHDAGHARPGYTGQPDADFLAMMIPHHEGAVDMVRQIAEEIIASQTVEIAAMRGRMAVLKSGPNPEPGGYPALGAVRGGR